MVALWAAAALAEWVHLGLAVVGWEGGHCGVGVGCGAVRP